MKRIVFSLISLLLLTGCGKSNEELEPSDGNNFVDDINEVQLSAVEMSAKSIINAAKSQYLANQINGTYITVGSVGELQLDKVYEGTWMFDEETEEIIIINVKISGYICNGSNNKINCEKE